MARRKRRFTMALPPLQTLFALVISFSARRASAQTAPCFNTLGAINSEMQTELIRIQNGATPQESYLYNLCANTFFDATSEALEPVLNNAMFVCGDNGNRANRCVVVGGNQQVRITDSLVSGFPLQEVNFMGITFSAFETNGEMTGASIAAFASTATTATFTECTWQEFMSDFVILQRAQDSVFGPMTVEIEGGVVTTGTAGAVFDNDGGLLRINNLEVVDLMATALVATANNGASFLEDSTISLSDVNSVTFTTAGGSQTVLGTSVTQMRRIEDAFYVEDVGSTLLLESTTIEQNRIQTNPWSAVSARTGSIARVSETSISDNAAVEFGIVAFDSSVTIIDSFISRNEGSESTGTTSATVFAITDATISMERVEINENTDFSGLVVALIRSSVSITSSCFQGGSAQFVVFIANDASFEQTENYVENFTSQRCGATGPRLFQEDADSGCFLGSSMCEGSCLVVADQDSCIAQAVPTMAPVISTSLPMASPVSAETDAPVLSSPVTMAPSTLSPVTLAPVTAGPVDVPVATSAPLDGPVVTIAPVTPASPTVVPVTSPTIGAPTSSPTHSPSATPSTAPTVAPIAFGEPTRNPTTSAPIIFARTNAPSTGATTRSPSNSSPTAAPTLKEVPTVSPATTTSPTTTLAPTKHSTLYPTIPPAALETLHPTKYVKRTEGKISSKKGLSQGGKGGASKGGSKGSSKTGSKGSSKGSEGKGLNKKSKDSDASKRSDISIASKKSGESVTIPLSKPSIQSNGSMALPPPAGDENNEETEASRPAQNEKSQKREASEPLQTKKPAQIPTATPTSSPSSQLLAKTSEESSPATPMPSGSSKASPPAPTVTSDESQASAPTLPNTIKESKKGSKTGKKSNLSKDSHSNSKAGKKAMSNSKGKGKKGKKANRAWYYGKEGDKNDDIAVKTRAGIEGKDYAHVVIDVNGTTDELPGNASTSVQQEETGGRRRRLGNYQILQLPGDVR